MATRTSDMNLKMRAGQLRHLATVEQPTRSQAASGQPTITWSTLAQTYVKICPLSGRDLWNAQQIQPDLTHRIEARWIDGVTSDMRLTVGSRVFHIAEPPENVEERNILLRMLCIERE